MSTHIPLQNSFRPQRGPSIDDATPAEWDALNHRFTTRPVAQQSKNLNEPQPAPGNSPTPAVWPLVIADMAQRDTFGLGKYRTRLQPHNGRDFLTDAYQEALDLVVYLRGAIYERDNPAQKAV